MPRLTSVKLIQLEVRINKGALLLALLFILPLHELSKPLILDCFLLLRLIWLISKFLEISSTLVISVLRISIMHPIIHWRLIESSLKQIFFSLTVLWIMNLTPLSHFRRRPHEIVFMYLLTNVILWTSPIN